MMDPIYAPISKRFHEDPQELADAFAKAWFKLYAPRYGGRSRDTSVRCAKESLLWQDPRSRSGSCVDWGAGYRAALKAKDSRIGAVHLSTGDDGLGVSVHVPRLR